MGLSKPVITTSTDISGITTTLAEIKGLAQSADSNAAAAKTNAATAASNSANAGAVKSVQRGMVAGAMKKSTNNEKFQITYQDDFSYSTYFDVTISSVTTSKAVVLVDTFMDASYGRVQVIAKLVNSTTVRFYFAYSETSSSNNNLLGGLSWQVVEYK